MSELSGASATQSHKQNKNKKHLQHTTTACHAATKHMRAHRTSSMTIKHSVAALSTTARHHTSAFTDKTKKARGSIPFRRQRRRFGSKYTSATTSTTSLSITVRQIEKRFKPVQENDQANAQESGRLCLPARWCFSLTRSRQRTLDLLRNKPNNIQNTTTMRDNSPIVCATLSKKNHHHLFCVGEREQT